MNPEQQQVSTNVQTYKIRKVTDPVTGQVHEIHVPKKPQTEAAAKAKAKYYQKKKEEYNQRFREQYQNNEEFRAAHLEKSRLAYERKKAKNSPPVSPSAHHTQSIVYTY